MENQVNVGDQNTQQIGQDPLSQPVATPEKPKANLLMIGGIVLASFIVFGFGGYFLGKQSPNKNSVSESNLTQVPSPAPSEASEKTADWISYDITTEPSLGYMDYLIKVPSPWKRIEHSSNFQDTETFQDAYGEFTYQLVIHQQKNYNEQTSKPYTTFKELTGFPYDVTTLIVDGQQAARVLPRAGSESIYKVLFFSKDSKLVISIELGTPRDGSKVKEGEELFNQILSTFKFVNKPVSAVSPAVATQNYLRPTSWKSVNISNHGISTCLPPKWEADEWGHTIFNRDSAYKPDVLWFNKFDYKGGSRRDEYINMKVQYEYEPEKLKNETKVSDLTINGRSVLKIAIPSFPEALVFVFNNKLYEVQLASWNLVNDSQSVFLKDVYTVVGCVKLL